MAKPRQPVDLILLKGNKHLTKQEIKERKEKEVVAKSDNVKPPTYLPTNLKRQFKKIADELLEIGIMTNLDSDALAKYLIAEQNYQTISVRLLEFDPLDDEYETLLRHQDKHFKMARSIANDLGLSISARCRLVVPKKNEDEKPKTKEQSLFGNI